MSWPTDGRPRFKVISYGIRSGSVASVLDRSWCHRVVWLTTSSVNSAARLRAMAELEAARLEQESRP